MPLNAELAKSLTYLRKKYKVSERDLVSLAKKLSITEEPEDEFQLKMQEYLKKRTKRYR